MSGWDEISIDDLRAEIDAYAGADTYTAENGWLSLNELSEHYGVNRHTMASWLRELLDYGRVEQAERPGRRTDGHRYPLMVYRMVKDR